MPPDIDLGFRMKVALESSIPISIASRLLNLNEHLVAQKEKPSSGSAQVGDRKFVLEHVAHRREYGLPDRSL